MRIHFKSISYPESASKRLKKTFAAVDGDVGTRVCEELIAHCCGYSNWYELRRVAEGGRADPLDWDVDDVAFEERAAQCVAALTACGIDETTAGWIIDMAGPTGEGATAAELRQAVEAWRGPKQWSLRSEGRGKFIKVEGDRKSHAMARRFKTAHP